MNEMKIFNSEEFGNIRVVEINGEPWFVGKDVASALGYEAPKNAVKNHVDEEDRILASAETRHRFSAEFDYKSLGQRGGWLINESGLYSLLLSSKLDGSKRFTRWVISEVLPSIKQSLSSTDNVTHEIKGDRNTLGFSSSEFGSVRVVEINGEPWFVAKDVTAALGLVWEGSKSISHVPPEWRGCNKTTPNGIEGVTLCKREMLVLSEQGLYFFLARSNSPKAAPFQKWLAGEVLPSIRKNGIYATDKVIEDIVNNPDLGIALFTRLKEEREARLKAERTNAILMHVKKTYTASEIAKEMGMRSAIELNRWLEEKGIQYKVNDVWLPRSDYADRGLFDIKQDVLNNGRVICHRRITQLGREFILGLLDGGAA